MARKTLKEYMDEKMKPVRREMREYVDEEGRTQITLAESEREEDMLCDFCSRKNPPYKVYDCEDFHHPDDPTLWSRGKWNACLKCAEMIDTEDLDGLAERCALILAFDIGDYEKLPMKKFHEAFMAHRIKEEEPK